MRVLSVEQNKKNMRSGRKQRDFEQAEADYQTAQAEWENDINNKKAWDTMWLLIQSAVFNNINKKLEKAVDKSVIEDYALDVTCNIMSGLKKKREDGKDWKINKVSSAVFLPCLAIYTESNKFNDRVQTFSEALYNESLREEFIPETEDTYMQDGILCINGVYTIPRDMVKSKSKSYAMNIFKGDKESD